MLISSQALWRETGQEDVYWKSKEENGTGLDM
jgi:hypothetical protein